MTAPVNKKFLDEFSSEKPEKTRCFGFLKGRKVTHKECEFYPITRSKAMDDIRIAHNPIFSGSENPIF